MGGAVVMTAVWPWDAAEQDDYSWFEQRFTVLDPPPPPAVGDKAW